jgi:hypothetical protein
MTSIVLSLAVLLCGTLLCFALSLGDDDEDDGDTEFGGDWMFPL